MLRRVFDGVTVRHPPDVGGKLVKGVLLCNGHVRRGICHIQASPLTAQVFADRANKSTLYDLRARVKDLIRFSLGMCTGYR